MTSLRGATLAALLASATTVAAMAQRPVFEMTGRVVDASSGDPVGGAAVVVEAPHISGLDRNRRLPSVMSGSDGGFRVPGLAAGAYGIRVLKPGYFERGGVSGGDLPIVRVGIANPTGPITVRLERHAVIRGRVVDADGVPMIGVPVFAMFARDGRDDWSSSLPRGVTDDRGEYELNGLRAGRYLAAVQIQQITYPVNTASRKGVVLLREPMMPSSVATITDDAGRFSLTPEVPPPADDNGRPMIHVTTFHPGVTNPAAASDVTVAAGETRSDIDIRMTRVPRVVVAGVALGPHGPLAQAIVRLIPDDGRPHTSTIQAGTHDDGRFLFLSAPPGRYRLEAWRALGSYDVYMGDPDGLWARASLVVPDTGLDDVVVTLRPGFTVSGRIQTSDRWEIGDAEVRLTPVDGGFGRPSAEIRADGTFSASGVRPGRYLVSVSGGGFLLSARAGGVDHADVPIEVGPERGDRTDLVLTLASRGAAVSGRVIGPPGTAPATTTAVLVFPQDQGLRLSERRTQQTRIGPDGRYRLPGLPPGAYYVVVVERGERPAGGTPAIDAILARRATAITLGEGEERTVDLLQVIR